MKSAVGSHEPERVRPDVELHGGLVNSVSTFDHGNRDISASRGAEISLAESVIGGKVRAYFLGARSLQRDTRKSFTFSTGEFRVLNALISSVFERPVDKVRGTQLACPRTFA